MKSTLKIFTFLAVMVFFAASHASVNTHSNIFSMYQSNIEHQIKCIMCKNGLKDGIGAIRKNHSAISAQIAAKECTRVSSLIDTNSCEALVEVIVQDLVSTSLDPTKLCKEIKYC